MNAPAIPLPAVLAMAACNVAAFVLFGVDKRRARRGQWRIREAVLLGVAACFGAAGALAAMHLFRHKTKKPLFRFGVPLLLAGEALLAAAPLIAR